MIIVKNRYIPFKGFGAINLFGVVFSKPDMNMTAQKINHEAIHSAQMRELLYIPFYLLYIIEWLYRLIFRKGRAYSGISFEREAYSHENDLTYLKHRKCFSMWRK